MCPLLKLLQMLWIWRCFVSDGNCSNFTVFRFTLKRFTTFHWFTERFFVGRFALFDVRPCNMLRVCLSVWFWYVIFAVCKVCSLSLILHHLPQPTPWIYFLLKTWHFVYNDLYVEGYGRFWSCSSWCSMQWNRSYIKGPVGQNQQGMWRM